MFNFENTFENLERKRFFSKKIGAAKIEKHKKTKEEIGNVKNLVEETRKFEEVSPENTVDPDSFVSKFIKPSKKHIIPSSVFVA